MVDISKETDAPRQLRQLLSHDSIIAATANRATPSIQIVVPPRDTAQPSPPVFLDINEIAPSPAPTYAIRTQQLHTQQEREDENYVPAPERRRRAPYRPRDAPLDSRRWGAEYMICRDPVAAKEVELYRVDNDFWAPPNTCIHCDAQSWPEKRGKDGMGEYWQCCDNSKNHLVPPDQSKTREQVNAMEDGPDKDRELRAWDINNLLYSVEDGFDNQQRPIRKLTARSKEFVNNIVSYNNCLSFTSEGTTNVDHRVARTTIRI